MIKNVEENINSEIFKKYFRYQNPSILEKDLFIANQVKNDQIGNQAIYSTNELRNAVIRKENSENEIPIKINDTNEKILEFNNKQKDKGLKMLSPKQMFQRLLIALAQVKAGNTSENSLNGIRKIVYSLYQSKEITKKVYNNIIKSMQL